MLDYRGRVNDYCCRHDLGVGLAGPTLRIIRHQRMQSSADWAFAARALCAFEGACQGDCDETGKGAERNGLLQVLDPPSPEQPYGV